MSNLLKTLSKAEPLSDYPSEAIRQAVEDIEVIENTPGFHVDMDEWQYWIKNECRVCQAGAVAMRRYRHERHNETRSGFYVESKYEDDCSKILEHDQVYSFNYIRKGRFAEFLDKWIEDIGEVVRLYELLFEKFPIEHWTTYEINPDKYKKNLLAIADILEKEGY